MNISIHSMEKLEQILEVLQIKFTPFMHCPIFPANTK